MNSYLKKLWWKYTLRLTSAFNSPSLLKSRVLMLYRKPSERISLAKFAFVLPILSVCVLVSAFAQRNFLPPVLVAETQKVANRFAQELQNAFLPTATEPTKEEEKTEKKAEKQPEKEEKATQKLPTENAAKVKNVLPSKNIAPVVPALNMPSAPADESKEISLVPAEVVVLEDKAKDFSLLKKYEVNGSSKIQQLSIILQKNTQYIFKITDSKTGALINNDTKIFLGKGVAKMMEEIELEKTDVGFYISNKATGLYKIILKNANLSEGISLEVYENKQDVKKNTPEFILVTNEGKEVNYKKKISTKKPLRLDATDKSKSYEVAKVEVSLFRDKKLAKNKTVQGGTIDFSDLGAKRGDSIQITIAEVVERKSDGSTAKADIKYKYIAFWVK